MADFNKIRMKLQGGIASLYGKKEKQITHNFHENFVDISSIIYPQSKPSRYANRNSEVPSVEPARNLMNHFLKMRQNPKTKQVDSQYLETPDIVSRSGKRQHLKDVLNSCQSLDVLRQNLVQNADDVNGASNSGSISMPMLSPTSRHRPQRQQKKSLLKRKDDSNSITEEEIFPKVNTFR